MDADGDWGTSGDRRTTNFTNDLRGRVLVVENPQSPHVFMKYDNRGRGLAPGLFSLIASISIPSDDPTTETTNRVGLRQTFYDERGQVWKTQRHNIDVSDGSDDDNVQSLSWYDADGLLIKSEGEQLTKTVYDRLHRATNQFILASDNDSAYADADDLTGDYVLEERVTYYLDSGAGAGQPLMQVTVNRHHDDTSTTGAFDADGDLSTVHGGANRTHDVSIWATSPSDESVSARGSYTQFLYFSSFISSRRLVSYRSWGRTSSASMRRINSARAAASSSRCRMSVSTSTRSAAGSSGNESDLEFDGRSCPRFSRRSAHRKMRLVGHSPPSGGLCGSLAVSTCSSTRSRCARQHCRSPPSPSTTDWYGPEVAHQYALERL